MRHFPALVLGWAAAASATAQHDGVTPASQAVPAVDFARQVRPILAQHCYSCHGPDAAKRKADLRLDQREDAFALHDGVAAFVAGKPDDSEALRRILTDDADDKMPPPDTGDSLKPAEIELLRRWLDGGAAWHDHWSFVPPVRPPVPDVATSGWPRGELDRFVLARLEHEGLAPNPEASREEWLRRITFDLVGLPPTTAELDDFLRDQGADAFEKVADRLLADPRYGERQATVWLDLARYADSSGYQRDTPRTAWKWRDWVIKALNDDMPFDRFTIEQLAGDLLPEPTIDQRIATGFNRNHPVNTEAGEELDEYRSAYVIDRVNTTATTWLGLSLGCAQCHDHKYDPVSQRDFYSFYGFFNNIKEKDSGGMSLNPKPSIAAPGPDEVPLLADLDRRKKALEQRLDREDPLADAAQAEWEQATLKGLGAEVEWTTLRPTEFMARHGSRLQQLDDGSILATGPVPARDTYDLVFTPGARKIQALRLEVLPDPSLPGGASGRADDGRFILSQLEVRLASVADSSDPPVVVFALAAADVNQKQDEDEHYLTAITPGDIDAALAVDDDGGKPSFRGGSGWSIAGEERKQPRAALLIPLDVLAANDTSILRVTLHHTSSDKFRSLIGRFRLSCTDDPRIRTQLLPQTASLWHVLGPFPAASVDAAFATEFEPEKDLEATNWKKKYGQPVVEEPKPEHENAGTEPAAKGPAGKEQGGKESAPADKPEVTKAAAEGAVAAAEPKPTPDDPEKGKAETAKPDAAQPESAKSAGTKPDTAKAEVDKPADKPVADTKPKPKPKRLEWDEDRALRDGRDKQLPVEGAASASYVSRRIHTDTARTMVIEFDGGVAAKLWLNGQLLGTYAPTAEAPAAEATKAKGKDKGDDEAAFFAMLQRSADKDSRRLRVGLRQGDNHLVIKLVGKGAARPAGSGKSNAATPMAMAMGFPMMFGGRGNGGISFRCTLTAEGNDVLDFETERALRQRAADGHDAVAAVDAALAKRAAAPVDAKKEPLSTAERQGKAVRRWYRTHIDVAGRALADELARVEREKRAVESRLTQALVMEELATPRPISVFIRGDYRHKGDAVTTNTPAVLPAMHADQPKTRLGLARWLVGGENPLVARVAVNHAWQQFFGLGLVRTADDFGIRGAPPSHPELLDWLATEFVASGWKQKQLHRRIVLSATYRQSGAATAAQIARDPDNELLARGPHQRLSAEMVRDQALAVSGLLVQKLGGASVKPYQPPGLWRSVLGSRDWQADDDEDRYRRGLYVYWKRGVPYPSFTAFDAPKRETCTVTRTRTTTPLQALVTLNDPVYVEAGRAIGARMLAEGGGDDQARIAYGFRLVTSRRPFAAEAAALTSLLADLRTHYQAEPKAAEAALGSLEPAADDAGKDGGGKPPDDKKVDEKKPEAKDKKAATPAKHYGPWFDAKTAPAEAAAWSQLGVTLLNLEAAIRRG